MLRQKKVTKEKATPSLRPLRGAKGQTRVGAVAGCAVELTALRCSFVQTATASQFTRHGRCDAHAHPITAPPQAQPAGVGSRTSKQPDIHSGHRCARPSLRSAWRLRPRDGAERSAAKQWPVWMSLGFPSGCAWGAQGAGWRVCRRTHALRELTHRSCLSGAPQARSEFCGAPRDRAPQVAPQRSEGVADSRVAFSLVTFFWRSKRKLLACRATPGSRTQHGNAVATAQKLRQAQPRRTGRERTIKTIAASALCRSASSQKTLRTNDSNRAEVGTALLPKARGPASHSTPLTRLPAFRLR